MGSRIELRNSPLVKHDKFKPTKKQVWRRRAHRIFLARLSGKSYEECGKIGADGLGSAATGKTILTPEEARKLIARRAGDLAKAEYKWKLAECRCHALAMELRLLRIGKEAAPDQPLDAINTPSFWLSAFHGAGIDTVNQLRSIDADMLLARWQFPAGAIDWAIMKLDKMGLSHALRRPARKRFTQAPLIGKRVIR